MCQLANSLKRSEKVRLFIEEIYKFYENTKNLAEFQEWKEAKASKGKDMGNDEINLDIEGGSVPNGYRYDRVN